MSCNSITRCGTWAKLAGGNLPQEPLSVQQCSEVSAQGKHTGRHLPKGALAEQHAPPVPAHLELQHPGLGLVAELDQFLRVGAHAAMALSPVLPSQQQHREQRDQQHTDYGACGDAGNLAPAQVPPGVCASPQRASQLFLVR